MATLLFEGLLERLIDDLHSLTDDLLNPLLDDLILLLGLLGPEQARLLLATHVLPRALHVLLRSLPPGVPFLHESLTKSDELTRDVGRLELVGLLELTSVLAQVLLDLLLLVAREEGGGTRAPEELLELVEVVLL